MTEVRNVVTSERKRSLNGLEDMIQAKSRSLRSQLTDSTGIQATSKQLMEELFDTECGEDDGEIMLLAMILLQLHGKFPSAELQEEINKKKRQRTSPDQLAILEQIFQTDRMPSQQTRVQLADQLGMSSRRVQIWFQNKRAKVKRGISKSSESIVIGEDDDIDSVPRNPLSVSTTISAPLSNIHLGSPTPSSPSPCSSPLPSSLPFRFIPPPGLSTTTSTSSPTATLSDVCAIASAMSTPSVTSSNSFTFSRFDNNIDNINNKSSNPLSVSSATVPVPPSSSSSLSLSSLASSSSPLATIAEEGSISPVPPHFVKFSESPKEI